MGSQPATTQNPHGDFHVSLWQTSSWAQFRFFSGSFLSGFKWRCWSSDVPWGGGLRHPAAERRDKTQGESCNGAEYSSGKPRTPAQHRSTRPRVLGTWVCLQAGEQPVPSTRMSAGYIWKLKICAADGSALGTICCRLGFPGLWCKKAE